MIALIILALGVLIVLGHWSKIKSWWNAEVEDNPVLDPIEDEVEKLATSGIGAVKRALETPPSTNESTGSLNASASAAQANQDALNTKTSGQAFVSSSQGK